MFNTGKALAALGRFYASAIVDSKIEFDVLFGPAYKGIPLAATAVVSLCEHHGKDVPYSFNRKEKKDHGEGGSIVGHPLKGKILVVDDVITAGTAIRESVEIIKNSGAALAGVIIALDRQERGKGELSAIQEVNQEFGVPVISVITLGDLIEFISETQSQPQSSNTPYSLTPEILTSVESYRAQYGVKL